MALNNNKYVKFVRGSATAWSLLSDADKSLDTLYFITTYGDDGKTVLKTEMYLGNQLISDGSAEQIPEEIQLSLKELTDVDIADSVVLEDGMFLGYNATTGQWEPRTQTEVSVDAMTGASSTTAGSAGLVPAPAAGDENKVLTGDGKWTTLSIPDTSELETQIGILIGEDAEKSVRTIAAEELAAQLIPEKAAESLDSLQEIADWIQAHPNDAAALNSKIINIEKSLFNEVPRVNENGEPVIDETTGEQIVDQVSKIGDLESLLAQAQQDILSTSTEVGQLEALLGAQIDDDTGAITGLTAVDKIEDIFAALDPSTNEDGTTTFKELEKITALEDLLGITEKEDGTIEISAAPIGNLEDLLLYQEHGEEADSLVKAINILTEQMTWGELPE